MFAITATSLLRLILAVLLSQPKTVANGALTESDTKHQHQAPSNVAATMGVLEDSVRTGSAAEEQQLAARMPRPTDSDSESDDEHADWVEWDGSQRLTILQLPGSSNVYHVFVRMESYIARNTRCRVLLLLEAGLKMHERRTDAPPAKSGVAITTPDGWMYAYCPGRTGVPVAVLRQVLTMLMGSAFDGWPNGNVSSFGVFISLEQNVRVPAGYINVQLIPSRTTSQRGGRCVAPEPLGPPPSRVPQIRPEPAAEPQAAVPHPSVVPAAQVMPPTRRPHHGRPIGQSQSAREHDRCRSRLRNSRGAGRYTDPEEL